MRNYQTETQMKSLFRKKKNMNPIEMMLLVLLQINQHCIMHIVKKLGFDRSERSVAQTFRLYVVLFIASGVLRASNNLLNC